MKSQYLKEQLKDESLKEQAELHLKQIETSPLNDVTDCLIARGDNYVVIINGVYLVEDYDTCAQGDITHLYQINDLLVLKHANNDYSLIFPVENPSTDSNWTHYKFNPYKGDDHMLSEKVVGTTFRFKKGEEPHYTDFAGEIDTTGNIPVCKGAAILMPEPTNEFDPNAVAVIAKMKNGRPCQIGYVPKNSELQAFVKSPVAVELVITAYSDGGDYNDSYVVNIK